MPKPGTKLNDDVAGGSTSVVFTVGHSTRSIEEFIRLLKAHEVQELIDVRTIPRSRHNPQFNSDALSKSLKKGQISYVHMPALGGLRHTTKASVNTGWRNPSFRGYADYMLTPQFENALAELMQLAETRQSAVMCAEAVPWRCHRSLIADALLVRGVPVEHIISLTSRQLHKLTPFAQVEGYHITYPADTSSESASGDLFSPITAPRKHSPETRGKLQRTPSE
jgi:uncharacterized protein (DUF488 family)